MFVCVERKKERKKESAGFKNGCYIYFARTTRKKRENTKKM